MVVLAATRVATPDAPPAITSPTALIDGDEHAPRGGCTVTRPSVAMDVKNAPECAQDARHIAHGAEYVNREAARPAVEGTGSASLMDASANPRAERLAPNSRRKAGCKPLELFFVT